VRVDLRSNLFQGGILVKVQSYPDLRRFGLRDILNCDHSPKLRLFSGMALPPDRLPTTGVAVFVLFTNTVRLASLYCVSLCN
jgi:hypothetical protein